jgi:hypothetical protein
MSGKEKVEQDYRELEQCLEGLAKEEIEKIRKRMDTLKLEVAKVGEAVEAELAKSEGDGGKKKS